MNQLLIACQIIPLTGLLLIFLTENNEKKIAAISFWFSHAMGVSIVALLAVWARAGFPDYEYYWFTLYEHDGYAFPILFYFDKIGAAYLFCIWTIFAIIVKYCRFYLHREQGYKRFFQTIFGFVFGLNLIVFAGNLDLLFAGWEIVGISSFLLIAFYRHRPQPVRNALRAYTVYRCCDVGLLLGALMNHLLFHESSHFSELSQLFGNNELPPAGYMSLSALSWLIILAASGKSAQFPFSFWLPRAMEGPTPSSAIFYGALSIHLGVFLLLRTMPLWSYELLPRLIIFSIGFLTVIVATLSEKTQSNIKGQVAYASIAQVGFMFMELSLGLESLVLVHFMGNAFLRCYQLLVSPSIIAHLLRVEGAADSDFFIKQSTDMQFLPVSLRGSLPEVFRNTLYVFALQEGNLERMVRKILWDPLKYAGSKINTLDFQVKALAVIALFIMIVLASTEGGIARRVMSLPVSVVMVAASLSAFSQKHSPYKVWNTVAFSSLLAGIAVWLMTADAMTDAGLFASGIIPGWLVGLIVLRGMLKDEDFAKNPFLYRAMAEKHPKLSLLLFLSFLAMVGFPISPAFLGEDLLISHASEHNPWFAFPITIAFVVNGIAVARLFVRLCMGRAMEVSVTEERG